MRMMRGRDLRKSAESPLLRFFCEQARSLCAAFMPPALACRAVMQPIRMSLTHVENRARTVPGTAELRSRHRSTIPPIDTFLQSLAELPLNAWLEIGQSIARERPHPTARDLALEHLGAAIRDHALEIV